MTLLFEKSYQNGNGKGVGGVRCALKLVRPLINECLNDKIVHYSKKMKNKPKVKKQNEIPIKKMGIVKGKSKNKSKNKSKSEYKSKTKSKAKNKTMKKHQKNKIKKKKDYLD